MSLFERIQSGITSAFLGIVGLTLFLLVGTGYLNWRNDSNLVQKKDEALLKSLQTEAARESASEALLENARLQARSFKSQLLTATQVAEFNEECRRNWHVELEGSQDSSDFTRSILRLDQDNVPISEWPNISSWLERISSRKGARLQSASIEAGGGVSKREFKRISLRIAIYCEKGAFAFSGGDQ